MVERERRVRTYIEDCWVCDGQKLVITGMGKQIRCGECNGTGELQVEESR